MAVNLSSRFLWAPVDFQAMNDSESAILLSFTVTLSTTLSPLRKAQYLSAAFASFGNYRKKFCGDLLQGRVSFLSFEKCDVVIENLLGYWEAIAHRGSGVCHRGGACRAFDGKRSEPSTHLLGQHPMSCFDSQCKVRVNMKGDNN